MNVLQFIQVLKNNQCNFFTGVPCSIFTTLIQELYTDSQIQYVPAPREDSALGMAAGAYLTGQKPVVLMQNSGLGYCLNVITSLNMIYKIPTLIVVSWRGYMGKDAPEHLVMGDICTELCKTSKIPFSILEKEQKPQVVNDISYECFSKKQPYVIFIKKDVLS